MSMKLAMKEQRPGAWHGGLWLHESGTGEGVLRVVKLEKHSNTSIKQYLVLAEIHLDFDSWSSLQIFGGGHGFMLVSQIAL